MGNEKPMKFHEKPMKFIEKQMKINEKPRNNKIDPKCSVYEILRGVPPPTPPLLAIRNLAIRK